MSDCLLPWNDPLRGMTYIYRLSTYIHIHARSYIRIHSSVCLFLLMAVDDDDAVLAVPELCAVYPSAEIKAQSRVLRVSSRGGGHFACSLLACLLAACCLVWTRTWRSQRDSRGRREWSPTAGLSLKDSLHGSAVVRRMHMQLVDGGWTLTKLRCSQCRLHCLERALTRKELV